MEFEKKKVVGKNNIQQFFWNNPIAPTVNRVQIAFE